MEEIIIKNIIFTLIIGFGLTSSAMASNLKTLELLRRSCRQIQGNWSIEYQLRYTKKTTMTVLPGQIGLKMEGWVSNSRVPTHALPRWSSLVITNHDSEAISEVITAKDEVARCKEHLLMFVKVDDKPKEYKQITSIAPGSVLKVLLILQHEHVFWGEYDPLLGTRDVTLTFGSIRIHDILSLDEQYLAVPRFTYPEPPKERKDTRWFVSPPDSLHLEAHGPGHQYYRFGDHPVRYNTKMRLRFWYLIAKGTEDECKISVRQCKETLISWRMLNYDFDQCLKRVGRWTKVERIIQTSSEATSITLEFKIVGESEHGEMWIDDVSLEPVGYEAPGGPRP